MSALSLRRTMLVVLTFFNLNLYADTDACGTVQTYRQAINCIAVKAPDIKQADLQVEVAGAEVQQAKSFTNPELQSKNFFGSDSGASGEFSTETELLLPIQLGNKRLARSKVASLHKESAAASAQTTKERVLIESAEAFRRLRQLDVELDLATEAIARFDRIISAFRRRQQLNPEQQVSLTVFRYALEEEKQKKSQILADQSTISTSLSLLMGQKLTPTVSMFPRLPEKWPEVNNKVSQNSAQLRFAKAKADEAAAELALARAQSWPDLKIGPAYERVPDRFGTEERIGVAISMDLPVLNRNQGGKRAAELSRQIAVFETEQKVMASEQVFESLITQYKLITEALVSSPSQSDLEKEHRAFENQFKRGLVSYSLIIEAHRQLHDTIETKHQQELRALDLLWRIYQLNGQFSPEVL